MKKFILILFLLSSCAFAFFKEKPKYSLLLSSSNPLISSGYDDVLREDSVFKANSRIYYYIATNQEFNSKYLKIQIIKQDDKAHVGGFSRIRNMTKMIQKPNYFCDYIVLSEAGKYYIQIFDITNLHKELIVGAFRIVD